MASRMTISTKSRSDFIDITKHVRSALAESGKKNGICCLYVPHTTAGITINENADPDVKTDMIDTLETLVPWNGRYRHFEGNSPAHVKATMTGFSVTVPFEGGSLLLGTWQCIYFCEFDGPRTRSFIVTIIGD